MMFVFLWAAVFQAKSWIRRKSWKASKKAEFICIILFGKGLINHTVDFGKQE
jgi:hypothetical protein